MIRPDRKTCGTRMMSSEPQHINYYKYFLRNGTSDYARDPQLHDWMLTVPRYARYFINHPSKQAQKTQSVFGAFEQRVLPNAYRNQTAEFQRSKKEGNLTEFMEGVPTTSVLEAPDVKEAFTRIEASVPLGDPQREQTINELKKKYIRERTTRPKQKDDQGKTIDAGRALGIQEESERSAALEVRRLSAVYRGQQGRASGRNMPRGLLVRLASMLGFETAGNPNRQQLTEMIESVLPQDREPQTRPQAESGSASYSEPQRRRDDEEPTRDRFEKMIKKRKENLEAKKKAKEEKPQAKQEKPQSKQEKPQSKPQEKPQPEEKTQPEEKPHPKQEKPKAKPHEKPQPEPQTLSKGSPKVRKSSFSDESDTESDSESDTDTESDDKPPPKKHAAKMKVFTHDNVRRQVNRPNLCNREYKSGYSRETIEQAKQELKRNRTNKSKMTQRNNIANRRFDASIFK